MTTKNYVLCPRSTEDYRIEETEFGYSLVANRRIKKGRCVFEDSLELCFRDVQEGDVILLTNNYHDNDKCNENTPICLPINQVTLFGTHGVGRILQDHTSAKKKEELDEEWHLESPGMFMNHSCDPSVVTTKFDWTEGEDIATRNIQKGEPLTCDYAYFDYDEDGTTFECCCGASNCRGKRIGFELLTPAERETILKNGNVSDAVEARHLHELGKGPPVRILPPKPFPRVPSELPRLVVPGPGCAVADMIGIRPCSPTLEDDPRTFGLVATRDIPAGKLVYEFWAQPWPVFPNASQSPSSLQLVAAMPLSDSDLPEGTTVRIDPHLCASRHADTGDFEFAGFDLLTHHSCQPNLFYDYRHDEDENWRTAYACRDIRKGELLTIDFDCHLWERPVATCLCGAFDCRGSVGGFSHLTPSQQEELISLTWDRKHLGQDLFDFPKEEKENFCDSSSDEERGSALSPFVWDQWKKASN